jgi:hypothetical protein
LRPRAPPRARQQERQRWRRPTQWPPLVSPARRPRRSTWAWLLRELRCCHREPRPCCCVLSRAPYPFPEGASMAYRRPLRDSCASRRMQRRQRSGARCSTASRPARRSPSAFPTWRCTPRRARGWTCEWASLPLPRHTAAHAEGQIRRCTCRYFGTHSYYQRPRASRSKAPKVCMNCNCR